MSVPDDDLTIDINLRPAQEVGERMLILGALIRIALLESEDDEEIDPADAVAEIADLRDALQIGPWSGGVTVDEREFIGRAGGRLTEADVLSMVWQLEALAALCWATRKLNTLSPPWIPSRPEDTIDLVPAPWDGFERFLKQVDLRTEEEIETGREAAELWSWRCAIEDDLMAAGVRDRADILETIRETAAEASEAALITPIRDDFAVERQPFSSADPETKALISEISVQRLHALNWLCGFGDSWDTVPLEI